MWTTSRGGVEISLPDFLSDLAKEFGPRLASSATIRLSGSELTTTLEVAPREEGPCRFVIFLQDEDEITIEFGESSVLDFHGVPNPELQDACREVVDAILHGRVTEFIYTRNRVPVRAVAYVEVPDRVISVRTRRRLMPFARKSVVHRYHPYVVSGS